MLHLHAGVVDGCRAKSSVRTSISRLNSGTSMASLPFLSVLRCIALPSGSLIVNDGPTLYKSGHHFMEFFVPVLGMLEVVKRCRSFRPLTTR